MDRILLVGEDFQLLASRAGVLSRIGANVTCCNSSEVNTHVGNDKFALVVLCHTLKEPLALKIIEEAHRRWPSARTLLVTTIQGAMFDVPVDAVTSSDPAQLVREVSKLLNLDKAL